MKNYNHEKITAKYSLVFLYNPFSGTSLSAHTVMRLSENGTRSEDYEKLRIRISASEENSGAV